MLDFVLIGFLVLSVIVLLSAIGGDPTRDLSAIGAGPTRDNPDAVLTVSGETSMSNKITTGTYEYTSEELKRLAGPAAKNAEYFGPNLESLLSTRLGLAYSSVLLYSAGSKKVQRLLQKKEVEDWIVAVEKKGKPLSWGSDGPFLLLNRKDNLKRVPRVLRIEAK